MVTRHERERLMAEALWQAFWHNELDELAGAISSHKVDGNDHPVFANTAKNLVRRLEDATI